ncbi:NAD(P)/FAD-dependent oxidoreductase [Propionispira raffinosivorans]|uniref:NAD(P)/FAD-dependent oxidoreductase n=1 Tax=Propionispira raffinosivorans TaxID=86959 RepID=UPI00037CE785|nr:NAD(P)/FAD-dependent oxidoreductase [Propionispira raffinosivorans]
MESTMTDIAIIGGGPAGLSAAINVIARGKSTRVFSTKNNYLERAARVDNYLGMEAVNGAAMMESFRQHAKSLGASLETGKIITILPVSNYFMLNFNGTIVQAKTVILAIGAAKQKALPGEEQFLGQGVSYCATCDGMMYRGKKAIVYGLADEAVLEANHLQQIGVNVTFVSAKQRPADLAGTVQFISGAITAIEGETIVQAVTVNETSIETNVVFILRNVIVPTALCKGLNLQDGFLAVNRDMETNIPGIFACGDCNGKPLQIAKAVGEGLIAAQQASKYIDDQKK